ncbi:MAG: hypothetical protein RL215_2532 [Planctomycetota bacterium]|jgi:hypothetical protein
MDSTPGYQVECPITYLTLRAAFLCSLDSLLRNSLAPGHREESEGDFLRFYPPLSGMAPQVQMECVLKTWHRLNTTQRDFPSPLDARILYAATELLANLAADHQHPMLRVLFDGPRQIGHLNDHWLPARARCLQISRETRFSQGILEELALCETASEQILEPDSAACQGEILEILGKWRISGSLIQWGEGLLTADEKELVRDFFEEHPGLTE